MATTDQKYHAEQVRCHAEQLAGHREKMKWHAERVTCHAVEMAVWHAEMATWHAKMAVWHEEQVALHADLITLHEEKTTTTSYESVYYTTMDAGENISWTIPVPTGASPEEALKTHLQSNMGFIPYDLLFNLIEPCRYVISCNRIDMVAMRFIKGCSVVVSEGGTTTETERKIVQEELCEFIKRYKIPALELTEIYSHYNITTIDRRAFYCCTSLWTIVIPDSVTTIGDDAFHGCTSLSTVDIPASVTTISIGAFHGCTSLSTTGSVYERLVQNYTNIY